MADPSFFDALRIPSDVLVALDNRSYHFALQPYHYIVRLLHVISMSAFFGGIVVLDLQMIGNGTSVTLRDFARLILPCVYLTFVVAFITGVMLFLYEPLPVGSHAYFAPKLLLTGLGMANAAVYNWCNLRSNHTLRQRAPNFVKIAGALSLLLWGGVIVFACMNVEGVPKVYLQP